MCYQEQRNKIFSIAFVFALLSSACGSLHAQVSCWQEERRGSFYFSAGYSSYTPSVGNLHIYQPGLNSSFDIINPLGSSSASGAGNPMSNLSYNMGYIFNYNQTWAAEFSYTPFQYYLSDGQTVKFRGIQNGELVDTNVFFAKSAHYHYYLKNGSAIMQFNIVRRVPLYRDKQHTYSLDFYGKAGGGPVVINPDIQFDSGKVAKGFSLSGGWNIDAVAGMRLTVMRHIYLELLMKYDVANINNININKGFASQNYNSTAVIINCGLFFSATHHNPMFRKGEKPRPKGVPSGPEPRGDLNPEKANADNIIEAY